jgi:hypothetical protein
MNKLLFPFSDDRIPTDKPGSEELARFIELNINPLAVMGTVTVSITSGNGGEIPNPLPHQGVLSFVPAPNAFVEEIDYLITVWCRGDIMTQAEAAAKVGVGVQTISSGVKRRQIRGFVNPKARNPRRGAVLVSWVEAQAMWGKK